MGPGGSASVSALVRALGPHGSAWVRAGTRISAGFGPAWVLRFARGLSSYAWSVGSYPCLRQCMWDLGPVGLKIVCFLGKVTGERLYTYTRT